MANVQNVLRSGEMKYDFYADPGHGWLKVQISELEELKIADKISGYSYMRKGWAYLEEDGDLTEFFKAKGFTDFDKVCRHHSSDKFSKIRNYEGYDYSLYQSLLVAIKRYDSDDLFRKWVNTTLDVKSESMTYFANKKKYDDLSWNAKTWFHGIVKNIKDEILKTIDERLEYLKAFNSDSLKPRIEAIQKEKKMILSC